MSLDENATDDAFTACMAHHTVPLATVKMLLAVSGFVLNTAVTWELRRRLLTARQDSTFSGIFYLNLNLTNILYSVSAMLLTLNNEFRVLVVKQSLMTALYGSSLTAGPLFLAVISLDCHFAVVHPIVYMTNRAVRSRGALYCMGIWTYGLGIGITIFCLDLQIQNPVCLLSFYISQPVTVFCNISVLQALYASSSRSFGQMSTNLNPTKRRAFWTVLSVLVVSVVCGLPQACMFTYRYVVLDDWLRFWCLEVPLLMMNSMIFGIILPIIYLILLGKPE